MRRTPVELRCYGAVSTVLARRVRSTLELAAAEVHILGGAAYE